MIKFTEAKTTASGARKILVVDDNPVDLKAMSLLLAAKGYTALLAESGDEAIGLITRENPDLILLDLNLELDAANIGGVFRNGFLVVDWADRMSTSGKIPVIIVSSLDPEQYEDRARDAGINTFFRKPVDKEELSAAIRAILGDTSTGQLA
jgi:CheY-like chemotaxis protein